MEGDKVGVRYGCGLTHNDAWHLEKAFSDLQAGGGGWTKEQPETRVARTQVVKAEN